VSLDDAEKNAQFAESMGAELPVVSDPGGDVARRFGVIGFGGLYSKRWTFYIDAEGILRAIDKDVAPETAGADIVGKLRALDFPRRKAERAPAPAPAPETETED